MFIASAEGHADVVIALAAAGGDASIPDLVRSVALHLAAVV